MNKKILAVILSLAMIVTVLTGCGSKDSTYFKEVKNLCKTTVGTANVEMTCTYSGGEVIEALKDKDGNQTIKIKYDATVESEKKSGVKISLKLGDKEYSELTTIVRDEKTFYMTVDPIVNTLKQFDEAMAKEAETMLTQMGISGAVSINIDQLMEALETEIPKQSDDSKKSAAEFLQKVFDIVEKDFESLQGQDGDDYTLSVNGDNADKAVDAIVAFLENDAEKLFDEFEKFMNTVYGSDNDMAASLKEMTDEGKAGIPDAIKEMKDSKEDIVKEIKDSKINIVSKVNSGKGTFSVDTGDIVSEDGEKINLQISAQIKEGKPSIGDMIPENASDITTMLIAVLNQASAMNNGSIPEMQ